MAGLQMGFVIALFAIFALLNFLMFRSTVGRFDVTATRVFTLAPQTIQVLEDLDTRVRANAFFIETDTASDIASAETTPSPGNASSPAPAAR